jgi:seryl-tRNA synthetase
MFLNEKQDLQEKKNSLSKLFSSKKENIDEIKRKVLEIKNKIETLNLNSEKKFKQLNDMLLSLPNLLSKKTPIGKSENDNKILKENGKKKNFIFKVKNHLDLAENLNVIDYDKAVKISGSRFSILKSGLAKLHRALINFMLDNNVEDFKYEECVVPELVKSTSLEGTGQLPKFDEDLFKTNFNDLWLIPTSEVPLTNLHRESIINLRDLPLRYTSFTNCFRSEAGASGKDTKGLMREHQFGKVELVTVSNPDKSDSELDRMICCVESILTKIDIPYKLVELCSADVGFSSNYTLDFEIWMPGQNKYREVSSCSNCGDFQSRRMKMRVKDFETGEIFYPHTLNGSSLAVGRMLIAIIENFQNEDGSIEIPSVLQGYTNGLKKICFDG